MSATKPISHRVGEAIFTFSSICEKGLTTVGEITDQTLTCCAFFWLRGKVFYGCGTSAGAEDILQNNRCQADDQALQMAIITKLACMSLLAGAIAAKCVSSSLARKKID